MPAIHVLPRGEQGVDGRDKRGHDDRETLNDRETL
jgi:hypothetical protein